MAHTENSAWLSVQAAYEERERELSERYQRSLPFQDAMFDRWARAERLGFGEGASVYNSALVFGNVSVGAHSWIGPYVLLDGSGDALSIGSWCSISAGVQVYTHDTMAWSLTGGQYGKRHAPVSIGDCCYLGSQCIVAAGAQIGEHCVIGANSYVNASIEPFSVAAGTPARRIGEVALENDRVVLRYDSGRTVAFLPDGDREPIG